MSAATWNLSYRADGDVVPIADRHYNRQKIGAPQFVPPGRCLVLEARDERGAVGAFWVTSFPLAEFVQHEWAGAWMCSAFRNERPDLWLSSDLIMEAVAITCWRWQPPELGMVTFVDPHKTKHKRDPGRCFRKAGFEHVGYTKGGLVALQKLEMPEPLCPLGASLSLDFAAVGSGSAAQPEDAK